MYWKLEYQFPKQVCANRLVRIELNDCNIEVVKAHKLANAIEMSVQNLVYKDSELDAMARHIGTSRFI